MQRSCQTMSCKNADRLSKLPWEIVSHILSLMPTKFAVRTTILSKRWRYSWMLINNLDFYDIHFVHATDSFIRFVDRVLDHCKTSQVHLFRLRCSKYLAGMLCISNWINKAVMLNVCELDIHGYRVAMPSSLFTCRTLTKLRLDTDHGFWDCLGPVNLPSLKIFEMVIYTRSFDGTFKVIHGSPVLESLSVEVAMPGIKEDYIFNIPTLKRLKLTLQYSGYINKVVLQLPNLEYLFVGGMLFSLYVMKDVSSLVEASVSLYGVIDDRMWVELLKGLSGVKSLSIEYIQGSSDPPIFSNLERLELNLFNYSEQVLQFLECCPGLKHLQVEKLADSYWIEPKRVPACVLTNLTTFEILVWWGRCNMKLLEYILGNAEVLTSVIITWDDATVKEEAQLCARLPNLLRASKCCEIRFNGSVCHAISS